MSVRFNNVGIIGRLVLRETNVLQSPVANFTANTTSGYYPLSVQFTDTSTNNPTSWLWDFKNDGTATSTLQNPSYTYATANNYTVKLTATNGAGSNTTTKINYVTVTEPPTTYLGITFSGAPMNDLFTSDYNNTITMNFSGAPMNDLFTSDYNALLPVTFTN